jgi:predicted dehydrogenase
MIARFHAAAVQHIRGCRVVAGADAVRPAAEAFAQEFACDGYDDYRALLERDDSDIVTVCTPSGAHAEPAIAAAQAGKHVLVEKPFEVTLARCDEVIRACRRAGVTLGVIFPSRFSDAATLARKAIDSGRLGRITLADAYVKWWRTQAYYDSGGWRGTWKLDGGGALMNQSIHAIDLLVWLAGPIACVQGSAARLAHKRIEVEDVAVATVRFRNGALGTIEGTTAAYPGLLKRIEICGDRGTIGLEEDDIAIWRFDRPRPGDDAVRSKHGAQAAAGGGAGDPRAISCEGHRRQFMDFIKAIETGRRPLVDGPEGRKAVEIILAIYKAAKTGRPVELPLR